MQHSPVAEPPRVSVAALLEHSLADAAAAQGASWQQGGHGSGSPWPLAQHMHQQRPPQLPNNLQALLAAPDMQQLLGQAPVPQQQQQQPPSSDDALAQLSSQARTGSAAPGAAWPQPHSSHGSLRQLAGQLAPPEGPAQVQTSPHGSHDSLRRLLGQTRAASGHLLPHAEHAGHSPMQVDGSYQSLHQLAASQLPSRSETPQQVRVR